jgi:hypothetical protein
MPSHYVLETAFHIGLAALLCFLVYARKIGNRLPYFSIYIDFMLWSSVLDALLLWKFGFHSSANYYGVWVSYALVLLTRTGATVELCRNCLRAYPGIWALAWRLFAILTVILLAHATWDASGQPHWISAYVLTLERDINISTFLILAAMLQVSHYYRIRLERLQQWIAIGISFYCVTAFANGSVLRDLLLPLFPAGSSMLARMNEVNEISNFVDVAASGLTLGTWCFLLRRPFPMPATEPVLLPANIYGEMSPAVNLQLRHLNDRILEMLRS